MEKVSKTYYDLLHEFWRDLGQYPLRPTAIALYLYLLHTCNGLRLKNPFNLSNGRICADLDMTKGTLDAMRKTLIPRLIEYQSGGKGRRQGIYKITSLDPDFRGQNLAPKTQRSTQSNTQSNTQRSTQSRPKFDPLYTIDKEKEKDIIERKNFYKKESDDFTPPKIDEVREYFREIGKGGADEFFNYNDGRGWRVGRNQIANWRAMAKIWESKGGDSGGAPQKVLTFDPESDPVAKAIQESSMRAKAESERKWREKESARRGRGNAAKGFSIPPKRDCFDEVCRENGISTANEIGQCFDYFSNSGWSYQGMKITNRDSLGAAVYLWKSDTGNGGPNT